FSETLKLMLPPLARRPSNCAIRAARHLLRSQVALRFIGHSSSPRLSLRLVLRRNPRPWRGCCDLLAPDFGTVDRAALRDCRRRRRKRGYAGIIATQRLSKLHKDAAAEANNVIIGRTWLDADQARAGDALGLSKADRVKLRDLGQGEFYA